MICVFFSFCVFDFCLTFFWEGLVSVCVASGVVLHFVALRCSLAFGGSFYFRIE
jgi:hypothetical protein